MEKQKKNIFHYFKNIFSIGNFFNIFICNCMKKLIKKNFAINLKYNIIRTVNYYYVALNFFYTNYFSWIIFPSC